MNDVQKPSPTELPNSLVAKFHRVGSLIPSEQKLVTISKDTTVAEALAKMEANHYSQLPVVAGDSVLGVFSYRFFSQEAVRRQKQSRNEELGSLPVEDFLEDFPYVPPNEDWTKVQRYLDEKDAFFVGHPDAIEGLVTTMDVYQYFRNLADPFILIAEIEETLRLLIGQRIPKAQREEVFERSLGGAYEGREVPQRLSDLSLDNYVTLIIDRENWSYFQEVLGENDGSRNKAVDQLKPLPTWRNDTFHFRRSLKPHEMKKLTECRNWLHRAMRAYEANQRSTARHQAETAPEVPSLSPALSPDHERLAASFTPAADAFYRWLLAEAQSRAADYAIGWHKTSYSVRLRTDKRPVGFLYAYSPERLEVYFDYLDLAPDELAGLRRSLLAYGVFTEYGQHSLNAHVSQVDRAQLEQACLYILDDLAARRAGS